MSSTILLSENCIKILIACEESQEVCKAFRNKGFIAFSCDLLNCSGNYPEWHIQQDVLSLLNGNCEFKTVNNCFYKIIGKWDLIIAHPPCTYLCLTGQKWCNVDLYGESAIKRQKQRDLAVDFFMKIVNSNCDFIAIENPVGVISKYYRKADQYIHPYQFGHPSGKKTGLWLKNLPKLIPTNIVDIEYHISKSGRKWDKWFWDSSSILPLSERSRFRSKTFKGIAEAMAEQWGSFLICNQKKGV